MKRILIFLALLTFVLSAQTRYYWQIPVASSNGRPLNAQTVYLFDATADTAVVALTYATGSPGHYYSTTAIPTGTYTLKMLQGGTYYPIAGHIGVKYTDWSMSEIRTIVGDSVAALSADGVTIENTGTIGQKVFADTTALKATSSVQEGSRLFLREIANNKPLSGGIFVKIPKGYSITLDNGIAFANADGDTLVREAVLQGADIQPQWYGAAVDGSTNDISAIHAARDAAIALGRPLYLPAGNYKVNDPIEDNLATLLTKDFIIRGDGVGRTIITATDTAFNFNHSAGYTRAINVEDLSIVGPGAATANSVGMYLNRLSSPTFQRLQLSGFEYLVTGTQFEASYWNRIVWGACSTAVYTRNASTLNGNTFEACTNTTDVIDVVYDWGAGYGTVITGGEGGNCNIFLRQDGTQFSQVTVDGVNLESCDSTFFVVQNNCQLSIKNSRLLNVGGTNTKYFVEGYGTSEIYFDNVEFQQDFPKVLQSGASSKFFDRNIKNKVKYAYSLTNNTYYTVTPISDWIFDNSTITADTSSAGRFTRIIPRRAVWTTTPEKIVYTRRFSNTEIAQNYITDGTDIRGTNSTTLTTQPGALHDLRHVYRWGNVTFSAGDSTVVTVTADTNGWGASTLYFADAVMHNAGNSGVYNVTATIKSEDRTAGNGNVTFWLWHNGINMSGITRRVLFHFVFYPQKWAQ